MDKLKFLKTACLLVFIFASATSCSNSDDENSISNEGWIY